MTFRGAGGRIVVTGAGTNRARVIMARPDGQPPRGGRRWRKGKGNRPTVDCLDVRQIDRMRSSQIWWWLCPGSLSESASLPRRAPLFRPRDGAVIAPHLLAR